MHPEGLEQSQMCITFHFDNRFPGLYSPFSKKDQNHYTLPNPTHTLRYILLPPQATGPGGGGGQTFNLK